MRQGKGKGGEGEEEEEEEGWERMMLIIQSQRLFIACTPTQER